MHVCCSCGLLGCLLCFMYVFFFFFSSRRRHTRCALVTGVQTCALPIWAAPVGTARCHREAAASVALDAHGAAHAAADAERGERLLRVAALHLVKEGHEDAGARGADRMAERDGAAVDVDLRSAAPTSELPSLMRLS